jgi:hypothetical protein
LVIEEGRDGLVAEYQFSAMSLPAVEMADGLVALLKGLVDGRGHAPNPWSSSARTSWSTVPAERRFTSPEPPTLNHRRDVLTAQSPGRTALSDGVITVACLAAWSVGGVVLLFSEVESLDDEPRVRAVLDSVRPSLALTRSRWARVLGGHGTRFTPMHADGGPAGAQEEPYQLASAEVAFGLAVTIDGDEGDGRVPAISHATLARLFAELGGMLGLTALRETGVLVWADRCAWARALRQGSRLTLRDSACVSRDGWNVGAESVLLATGVCVRRGGNGLIHRVNGGSIARGAGASATGEP